MQCRKILAAHSLSTLRAAGTVAGVAPREAMRPGQDIAPGAVLYHY